MTEFNTKNLLNCIENLNKLLNNIIEEIGSSTTLYWDAIESMDVADNLLDYYKLHKFTTPVFCSEEPWRQDGWCDDQGRCWYGNVAIKGSSHPVFSCSIWKLSSRHPDGVISLPHYALIEPKND
jgi:hypothetical protein